MTTQQSNMEPPYLIYISGSEQFSNLKNPRRPLESPPNEKALDAAYYRDLILQLFPRVEEKYGPVMPFSQGKLYPNYENKPYIKPAFLGIFPTIGDFMTAAAPPKPQLPSVPNMMDVIIIHSDYFTELWVSSTSPSQRQLAYKQLHFLMTSMPIFILEAASSAEDNQHYLYAKDELADYLFSLQVPTGVRPHLVPVTTYDPNNPEAEWDMLSPYEIAANLYDAIERFLATPPDKGDPYQVFNGNLARRTDPDLSAIQSRLKPDEVHLNGSPYLGRVITVTSKKGGTGKTTTSLGIAHALTTWGKEAATQGYADHALKVIVIDLDLQDGQVGFNTNDQSKTVTGIFNEYREKYATLGKDKEADWNIIRKYIIRNERTGYDTLLAPEDPNDLNDLEPNFYREIINTIREHYDVIIIDTSVLLNDPYMTQCAYLLTYKLYYVAEPYPSPLNTMRRQFSYGLGSSRRGGGGLDPRRINIFVNKVEPEHIVKKGSAVAFWDVQDYAVAGIRTLTGVPYLHEAALDAVNPHLPGGFNYLLNNKGYDYGMSVLAHDITRNTGYQLFSPEKTAALEQYFTEFNL